MVDARCPREFSSGGVHLIGRTADGIPVGINGNRLRSESQYDAEKNTYVYVALPDGTLDRALLALSCDEHHRCNRSVVPDTPHREAQRREAAAKEAAWVASIRAKGWSAEVTRLVIAGQIRVGMTEAQVRAAWGEPRHVNRTESAYGTSTQWVYGSRSYVYFRNGVVSAIQQ